MLISHHNTVEKGNDEILAQTLENNAEMPRPQMVIRSVKSREHEYNLCFNLFDPIIYFNDICDPTMQK